MTTREPMGVLFVCHGNICRSPLAEGIFRALAIAAGREHEFRIDSAGTWAAEGNPPHPESRNVARAHRIDLTGSSRSIRPDDLRTFQHIIAMDRANHADLLRLLQLAPVLPDPLPSLRLFRSIATPSARGRDLDVPDPLLLGRDAFERLYDLLHQGCELLLRELTVSP